jgi:hypothetical protein
MVDAVLQHKLEYRVSLILFHAAQRGGAENDTRASMAGASERLLRYHVDLGGCLLRDA